MGLYSSLDDYLEQEGRPSVDEDIDNEGNIPDSDPDTSEPQREENITSSESQPETPQTRGNVQPEEDVRPDSPQRQENIQPEESGEQVERQSIPVSENAPEPPQHSGNIEPRGFQPPEAEQGQREASEENRPETPRARQNIRPDEENRPDNPNLVNIEPDDEAQPESPETESRSASENVQPEQPNRRIINLREEVGPPEPNRSDNISSEDSRPNSPRKSGNIQPTEEPPSTQPMEESDVEVSADAENQIDDEGNIKAEDRRPQSPSQSGNIKSGESAPSEAKNRGNIESEEAKPESPQKKSNITTEDDPPEEPTLEENIDPADKENTDGTGTDPLSEPQKERNIKPEDKSTTDGTGTDPLSEPQKEGNIDPSDESVTDGIGGEEIDREQPLKFQSSRFENQIDPENVDFVDQVPGDEDGVGEWEVPLRHQPEAYANQINPRDASVTDGIGGNEPGGELQNQPFRQSDVDQDPESPKQNRYQPVGLEASPYLGEEYTDTDSEAIFPAGEANPAPEWEVPLRHQPPEFANQIDQQSEEFRDGIGDSFTGEGNGVGEWEVPLRFQPEPIAQKLEDSATINPDDEGGRYQLDKFVAGSNEPGDDIRNMVYSTGGVDEKLRHQTAVAEALENGVINPSFEGGNYLSPLFVAGSNEPGDNVRDMAYGQDGATENLRFQPENITQKLRESTIINPDDEGGRYQLEKFVAGSNEPGDDIRDMQYDTDAAIEDLRFQTPLRPKLRNETIIDPSDEGGRYQLEKFVAGSNEPGDDIRDMGYDDDGVDQELRFQNAVNNALDNGTIDPNFEGGRYLLSEFVAGSNEPGDNVRDMTYDQDGATENLRHQPQNIVSKLREATIINPDDEGGRYQLDKFVAGSDEPGGDIRDMEYDQDGAVAPLRFQPENIRQKLREGTIINPDDEGGRYQLDKFVTGSNEPGEDIRDMGYSTDGVDQEIRHQNAVKFALENDIIDPSFEGGRYLLSEFVAGSNEPGDDIRDMGYSDSGVNQELRFQKAVNNALDNGTIDPDFEGGRYLLPKFVTGSDEPGGDIRDMEYDQDGAVENLRFQPENITQKLRESTIINPDDEGGRYQLDKFVAGSNEPGDDIRDMEYDIDGATAPLRFQPDEIQSKLKNATVISPDDEGGRYQLDKFVAGSDEPGDDIRDMEYDIDGATAPLRFQPEEIKSKLRDATIINPDDEGGRYQLEKFVAGSNEPGDDIRDMAYDDGGTNEKLRFQKAVEQSLDNGTIDPGFEGGNYLLSDFVAGSNEPGDNIRDMEYNIDGATEKLRFQPETITKKLREATIINPDDEGGRYQLNKFVAGSNEPGDDIRDMAYDFGGAEAPLRHQPEEIQGKLESATVIDPSDEGGRYISDDFVAGSDEPGDDIRDMEYNLEGAVENLRFQPPELTQKLRDGTIINPDDEGGRYQLEEFVAGSDEPGGDIRDMEYDVDGNAAPLRHQSNRYREQIDPSDEGGKYQLEKFVVGSNEPGDELPEFQDAAFGDESGGGDNGPSLNPSFNSKAPKQDEFEQQNERIRLKEFDDLFEVKDTGDRFNPGFTQEPFIQRKPVEGGGNVARANIKQADSRTAPVGARALAVERTGKFFATAKAAVYNAKQFFLQNQNPRKRTRIYDPSSPVETAAFGMAERPGHQVTRHLSADSGAIGSLAETVGLDVPNSSRYEDEIEEESTNTEWGEMTGSLFWQTPVAEEGISENRPVSVPATTAEVETKLSNNTQNIKQLFNSSEQEGLTRFGIGEIGGKGIENGYLFTKSYDPQGGPNSEGRSETDNYYPGGRFVLENPINSDVDIQGFPNRGFNDGYVNLLQKTENERDEFNRDRFFPYLNPSGSPEQNRIEDGEGGVRSQIQNESGSDVYFENRRFFEEVKPLHRGVSGQKDSRGTATNRGLPNYSKTNENGERQNRIDTINRLEPIIGQNAADQETYGKNGEYSDLIPFKFYDIENDGLLVFRAFVESISDNLSPEWSQQDYAGRPESGHIYGGFDNTVSFSFKLAPFSKEEFKAIWKKLNYLKGLTTPAGYNAPESGGGYMTPPFMRLTIGDMFNDLFGYLNSLTISVNEDMDWELREQTEDGEDLGRLPKGVDVDVDWQVIHKRAPVALQKYYDAPFLEQVDNPFRENPDENDGDKIKTGDTKEENKLNETPRTESSRAFELANEQP